MASKEKKISQKSVALINEIMTDFDWAERKSTSNWSFWRD